MKSGTMLRTAAGVLLVLLAIVAQPSVWSQTFTTFDPPGSLGTSPVSINPAGHIVGNYYDLSNSHGFLRVPNGALTTIDAPGAVSCAETYPCGTSVSFITPQGMIVGTYFDASASLHIFLRATDGTFTDLVVPGASQFVGGVVGNTQGAVAGGFYDSSFNNHGFLRAPSGQITVFDLPASFAYFGFVGMTAGGAILGSYADSSFVNHGFVREPNGSITTFDAPNAVAGFFFGGTTPTSINNSGVVTGFYYDSTQSGTLRYFVRATDGTMTAFNPTEEGVGSPAAINSSGAIAGSVQTFVCPPVGWCINTPVSFLRAASGTIGGISYPGAAQGTLAAIINPSGVVAGTYFDANGLGHGFVRKP